MAHNFLIARLNQGFYCAAFAKYLVNVFLNSNIMRLPGVNVIRIQQLQIHPSVETIRMFVKRRGFLARHHGLGAMDMKPHDRPEDGGNQNRRGFLKTGAASIAVGLSAGSSAPYASGEVTLTENSQAAARTVQDMMPTRNLGKTGFRVGIVGLGGQGALEKANNESLALQMIRRALELGVNYFDTSAIYGGPDRWSERYLGKGPQKIPGKVLCAYYDLGGEGVAYHDTDPTNHGSGELNPSDGTYLNVFRIHEGVDTSYTKFNRKPDPIDDNPFDKIVPPADLLYVGWTEPGEWFNVTVDVAQSGTYAADFLYTSNRGGKISLDVNGKYATGALPITTTNDPADPLAWRQWHHWNLASQLFKVRLSKGTNVLTVHIVTNGNMNLAYFDFKPEDR